MELNSILFRPPRCTYNFSKFEEELIWISNSPANFPCLYLQSPSKTRTTLLYFHANAEDLGNTYPFLNMLRNQLDLNILAPEYPGYGLYKGNASCMEILSNSLLVYRFLISDLETPAHKIIVMGRSIGSGPACFIAKKECAALILISPYKTLRNVFQAHIGKVFKYLIKNQMNNSKYIAKVKCPKLFIHGKKDKIIPLENSFKLIKKCTGIAKIIVPEQMGHNDFSFFDDIFTNVVKFLSEIRIDLSDCQEKRIPEAIFRVPWKIMGED